MRFPFTRPGKRTQDFTAFAPGPGNERDPDIELVLAVRDLADNDCRQVHGRGDLAFMDPVSAVQRIL